MRTHVERNAKILVTGAHGMVGTAIVKALREQGFSNLLEPARSALDLLSSDATDRFFATEKPDYVLHIAAVVFGLGGNLKNQMLSLSQNTIINQNVLMAAAAHRVRKIFFAGTVASYPFPYRSLPLVEEDLFMGLPHHGEFGYASAKRHAYAYLDLMRSDFGIPFTYGLFTNMYGPNDRFDIENSHVIPSLIKKVHEAKRTGTALRVWGNGTARRDFMHVNDAAAAAVLSLFEHDGLINISSGQTHSMKALVDMLVKVAGFHGDIVWDVNAPTGIVERSVSNDRLRGLGFVARYDLSAGLADAYDWYCKHLSEARQ
jgi:GDP-L-fucose synthase